MGDVVLGKKLWYKFRAYRPGVEPLQDAQTLHDGSLFGGIALLNTDFENGEK